MEKIYLVYCFDDKRGNGWVDSVWTTEEEAVKEAARLINYYDNVMMVNVIEHLTNRKGNAENIGDYRMRVAYHLSI